MEGENAFDNNITHGDEHILDGTNNVIYCKQNNLHMTSQTTPLKYKTSVFIQIHIADVFVLRNLFDFPVCSFKIISHKRSMTNIFHLKNTF